MKSGKMNLKKMQSVTALLLSVLLAAAWFFGDFNTLKAEASNIYEGQLEVYFSQTDARNIGNMINEFRTGGSAWYWNEDNTTKTQCGQMSALTYSYELEKLAMQRAAELVVSYSHTRPDGRNTWSVYSDFGVSRAWAGENIAMGQSSAEEVNLAWREDNEDYNGQGHRRNMLNPNFTAVGVAHVVYNGRNYWVEEFASGCPTGSYIDSPEENRTVSIKVDTTGKNAAIESAIDDTELEIHSTMDLPEVFYTFSSSSYWIPSPKFIVSSPDWTTDNPNVITISGNKITAVGEGNANLTVSENGVSKTVKVTVWNERMVKASDGKTYYHKDGGVVSSANGLISFDGKKYYLINGCWQENYTGLVEHNGALCYVKKGLADASKTGFVDYNGEKYYVSKGVYLSSAKELVQDPENRDDWYYCLNGKVLKTKSGLTQYNKKWFFVMEGKLDTTYNGFVDYDGSKFFVARGMVMTTKQGLTQDPNKRADWYFLANGQVQTKKTGVVVYNKAGFYVVSGKLDTSYTGTAVHAGKNVKIVNGRMQ